MMTLHTLNASPASAAFADCLRLIAPGDALLLLGDGVYAALAGTGPCRALDASGAQLYILGEDAAAAGVLAHIGSAAVVDIDGFVALSERFSRQLAWY
jgi:tRNA 2-thiouridine synthesizing protein B